VELALRLTRLPVVVGVVLIVAEAFVPGLAALKVGAVVLLAALVYLATLVLWIAFGKARHRLTRAGQTAVWIAVCSLPFYGIRVVYLLLNGFGPVRFSAVFGSWHILAGMGFAMEVVVVVLLIAGGLVVEPLTRSGGRQSALLPVDGKPFFDAEEGLN
jgi:hypothetical protein